MLQSFYFGLVLLSFVGTGLVKNVDSQTGKAVIETVHLQFNTVQKSKLINKNTVTLFTH